MHQLTVLLFLKKTRYQLLYLIVFTFTHILLLIKTCDKITVYYVVKSLLFELEGIKELNALNM